MPKANGARDITDADRAAPLEARFSCLVPTMIGSDRPPFPPAQLELHRNGQSLVLFEEKHATINHWLADGADHFLSWYPSTNSGTETIVDADRKTAMVLMWTAHPNDPGAMVVDAQPDGSSRPRGTPFLVTSCWAEAVIADAAKRGEPVVQLRGATPVALTSDSLPKAKELVDFTCSREGRDGLQRLTARFAVQKHNVTTYYGLDPIGKDESYISFSDEGSGWQWMPTVVYFPADQRDVAYVGFGQYQFGWRRHFFRVALTPDGHFDFALGPLTYAGQVQLPAADPEAASIELDGRTTSGRQAELWCQYGAPSVRRRARPQER